MTHTFGNAYENNYTSQSTDSKTRKQAGNNQRDTKDNRKRKASGKKAKGSSSDRNDENEEENENSTGVSHGTYLIFKKSNAYKISLIYV